MSHNRERLTVRPTERVPEAATVRHVDQLSEETLNALVAMADGESVRAAGVESGDIVVFTSYLRVVRADRGREAGRGETVEPVEPTEPVEAADADEPPMDAGPVG